MRLRHSPVAVVLIVPAGVLAGHAVGYAGAGHVHGGAAGHPHGYLAAAMAVAAPLAALALLVSMLRPRTGTVSFAQILVLQWGALVVQEAAEHVVAGFPPATLLLSRPLWLALLAQLAAAAGASLLLRTARSVGTRLASLPGRFRMVVLRARERAIFVTAPAPRLRPRSSLVPRAPPAVLG